MKMSGATWAKGLAGAVLLAVAACGGANPEPAGSTPEMSAIAHKHRSRCGACHTRVEPGERTREQLEAALARHHKRVRLTEEQWAAMIEYLAAPQATTAASTPPTTAQ